MLLGRRRQLVAERQRFEVDYSEWLSRQNAEYITGVELIIDVGSSTTDTVVIASDKKSFSFILDGGDLNDVFNVIINANTSLGQSRWDRIAIFVETNGGPTSSDGTGGGFGGTGPTGASGRSGFSIVGATGPTGHFGDPGDVGATGPTGAAGTNGADGNDGANGAAGAAGPTGPAGGPTGPTGAGATGPSGPSGARGNPGADGTDGQDGDPGIAGPTGTAGAVGATGPTGAGGAAGSNGAAGATGPTGPTGANGAGGSAGPTGPTGTSYDIALYFEGTYANSENLLRFVATRGFVLPASLTGSFASANTASSGNVSLTLKQNGSSIGTVAFNTSATGSFTFSSPITFVAGDVLTIIAPTSADATLADVAISLLAAV